MQLNSSLDLVHAELLPDDKAKIIADLQKSGVTAMVGDGINDAAAMVTADISISMGIAGSALAVESSKIILMSNDLGKIPEAIRLARKAFHKLITNVIISISLKVAILGLAFAGYPLIWAAVLTDVGACFIVILNSMQLLQENTNHESEGSNSRYGTFSLDLQKGKRTIWITDENTRNRGYKRLDSNNCSGNCCNTIQCKDSHENGTKTDNAKIDTLNGCLGCCEEGRSTEPESPNLRGCSQGCCKQ
ncbi:hypothetical protein MLD38_027385 [Melastoma candidum]|uniref:Uncharacterized protein n=1 Tax=Melastoma candidum TaxID=119954 RepID=A0ACB9P1L3_9MYRT|nr:hypothetical protein MLD38_027385 [Melastoma candidum]